MTTAELIEQPTTALTPQEQLQTFVAETEQAIAAINDKYGGLTVEDVDDTAAVKAVTAAHKEVKAMLSQVEKTRVQLKEDSLNWGRLVDSEAKRLKGGLSDTAASLKAERDKVEQEKQRRKEAKERAAQEALQQRVDALVAVNGDTSNLSVLRSMSDDRFAEVLQQATEEHERQQARAAEQEAAALLQMELLGLNREVPVDTILQMDADARQRLLEQATADHEREETERLAKEEAERVERERLEEERRQQQRELDALRAEKRALEEREAERVAAEAEAQRQAEEAERAKLEEAKRQHAEAQQKKREEALRPEREQLGAFANTIASVTIPEQLEGHAATLRRIVNEAAEQVWQIAESLT